MPIAFMLLFVSVFGGAIGNDTGTDSYVTYLLPGILRGPPCCGRTS